MLIIRNLGSKASAQERPGLIDEEILEMITTQVIMAVREVTLEVFRSIKTDMIEMFDERYVAVIEVVVATTIVVVAAVGL